MSIRDELGVIYEDTAFAPLFSSLGQPAKSPWRLALVTLMQFAENLSDRQAADAVRSRIDWKYALGLELTDPGFDSTVLCEFRARLLTGDAEQLLLDTLLQLCRERGWLNARGRQRTDSTHVLGAIQALNRLQCVHETMRHALNTLALVAPEWLQVHSQPEWVKSYGPKADEYRLPPGKERRMILEEAAVDRLALADEVGRVEMFEFIAIEETVLPEYDAQPEQRQQHEDDQQDHEVRSET